MIPQTICIRSYCNGIKTGRNLLHLKERGFFQNVFPQNSEMRLAGELDRASRCVYCGFDPTADSLHVGHLLPIIALIHCQRAGHEPIALIGGSTGLVGDPSGLSHERVALSETAVQRNVAAIHDSIQTIVSNHASYIRTGSKPPPHPIKILNNSDWYKQLNLVEFLSKIGREFRMGPMLNRHSVKSRLESVEGMSFTEFTYQIFQAYDWLELYRKYNCILQIGGNDQLGNMMSGHDLIGRLHDDHVYSLTVPLVTSTGGVKLGKTQGNAVWLNPSKTTAFDLYQYFINVADSDAERYLRLFTFLSEEQITDIMHQQKIKPEQRAAQKRLAEQVTLLVHGENGVKAAKRWTRALISRDVESLHSLNQSDLLLLFKSAPCIDLVEEPDMTLLDMCMKAGCFNRPVDGERVINEGGVRINHERVWKPDYVITNNHILPTNITLVQIGKKSNFYVIRWH